MTPDVISMGEPLLEFNATGAGSFREVRNYEVGWGEVWVTSVDWATMTSPNLLGSVAG